MRTGEKLIRAEAKRLGLDIKSATWHVSGIAGRHWRIIGPKVEVYAINTEEALAQLRTLAEVIALEEAFKAHRAEDVERRRQAAGEALFKSGTFRGDA